MDQSHFVHYKGCVLCQRACCTLAAHDLDAQGAALQAVAERVIYDQDPAIAAMGDVQNLPDYNWCALTRTAMHA